MKIVCVEPIGISQAQSEELKREYAAMGHEFVWYADRKEDAATLTERMRDAEVVIISNIKLPREVLAACPQLKMLSVAFTGVDHIDIDYCREHGICVCNASGYATVAVAELAIGLMLDVYRRLTVLDAATRQGSTRNNFQGRELCGKTVGIVGTGAIGCKTALLLKALGCRVQAWSRSERALMKENGIPYVDLDTLMRTSDIISLHVPLTPETHHLISAEKLALCKPTAVLINTARGNVVDMDALAVALNEGQMAGAGIDVFDKEPPLAVNHPLLQAPNCVVVPHVGYATREAFDIRIGIVNDNIKAWLNGAPINVIV